MTSKSLLKIVSKSAVACVAALALTTGVSADEHESKPEGEAPQAGMDMDLANQLASYGDRNEDALALIVAASIKQGLGSSEADEAEKESEGEGEGEDKDGDGHGNSVEDMLARASEYAGDNAELAGMIADVEAEGARGDIQGPGCYQDAVLAGYTDIWNITFTPGSNYIALSGDGDTDLDLYVYDRRGNLICQSLSYYDDEYCSWYQSRTRPIRVEVKNLGYVYNVYDLCTN